MGFITRRTVIQLSVMISMLMERDLYLITKFRCVPGIITAIRNVRLQT